MIISSYKQCFYNLHSWYYNKKLYLDDAEDPACVPMLWISKWVDYSDKYGLGYQLCDESVGVLFNDSTRLILCSSGEYVIIYD